MFKFHVTITAPDSNTIATNMNFIAGRILEEIKDMMLYKHHKSTLATPGALTIEITCENYAPDNISRLDRLIQELRILF